MNDEKKKHKRVKPSNRREQRVLAWCNKIRAKCKKKSVKTFAQGQPMNPCGCVIANTLGGDTYIEVNVRFEYCEDCSDFDSYLSTGEGSARLYAIDMPKHVRVFMGDFDFEKLPAFVDEPVQRLFDCD